MEKVKVAYPITDSATDSLVFKRIFASLAGSSIPAVIFYFLM
jgi:hypothetical protein